MALATLFVGRMDDVHVFETARTAAQVALEFGGEFSSNLPGLVLDLPFDESAGNVVFDHSEQQNDGQLGDGVPSAHAAARAGELASQRSLTIRAASDGPSSGDFSRDGPRRIFGRHSEEWACAHSYQVLVRARGA